MNWYKYSQNEPNRLSPEEEAELQELMRLQQQAKILATEAKQVEQQLEQQLKATQSKLVPPGPSPAEEEAQILNEFTARRNKQNRQAQANTNAFIQKLEQEAAELNNKLNELTQRFLTTHNDRSQWNDMIKLRWQKEATPILQSLKLTQAIIYKHKQMMQRGGQTPQASTKKNMYYYKTSQVMTRPELQQAYESAEQETTGGIQFRGMGQSETLTFPGSNTPISANELLNQIRSTMGPAFRQYGIHTIDTDPIPATQAVGLANSHEPGVIHIDLRKLFNAAKRILPPTSQLDSPQVDPDVRNSIISKIMAYIYYWLQSQLVETAAHEGRHRQDFTKRLQEGAPDMNIEEYPAETHGKEVSQRMIQPFPRSLEY